MSSTAMENLYSVMDRIQINENHLTYVEKIKNFRELAAEENSDEDLQICQWEIDAFCLITSNEGRLLPLFGGDAPSNGKRFSYPSIETFSDKQYQYYSNRLSESQNPFLKARYAHILWESPKPHANFALTACRNYLIIARSLFVEGKANPEGTVGVDAADLLLASFSIGKKLRQKREDITRTKGEIEDEILTNIYDSETPDSSKFYIIYNLVRILLKNRTLCDRIDHSRIEKICYELSLELKAKLQFHFSIQFIELGEKISNKFASKSAHNWRKIIAEINEEAMNTALKNGQIVALDYYKDAIRNYKRVGNQQKIIEITAKYSEIQSLRKFDEYTSVIQIEKDKIKKITDLVKSSTNYHPFEILENLQNSDNIIPRYVDVEKTTREHIEKSLAHNIAGRFTLVDSSGNPSLEATTEEEKKHFEMMNQYSYHLFPKMLLIEPLMIHLISTNKITVALFYEFIVEHSWIGTHLTKQTPDEKEVLYCWMERINPSLSYFFREIKFSSLYPLYPRNFILCTDTLALTFEGIIRDFLQRNTIYTKKISDKGKSNPIIEEKDLGALLHDEQISSLIEPDDLLFFKYLFVEKAGLNMRHRIAHCLLDSQEYDLRKMILIILALLRLSKYKLSA